MGSLTVGRIDRPTFWLLTAFIFVLKYMLHKLDAGILGMVAIMLLLYFVWAARLQDFGAPAWLAGLLLLVITVVVVVAVFVYVPPGGVPDARSLPEGVVLAVVLPELLATLLAGTVPGHARENAFGRPRQGLAGVFPRRVEHDEPAPEALPADRLAGVLGRSGVGERAASTPAANRPHPGSSRPAAFGRR